MEKNVYNYIYRIYNNIIFGNIFKNRKHADRLQEIQKAVQTEHMSTEERGRSWRVVGDFPELFHLKDEMLFSTAVVQYEIRTSKQTRVVRSTILDTYYTTILHLIPINTWIRKSKNFLKLYVDYRATLTT